MKEEIIQTFQGKIIALDKNDPFYQSRKEYFKNKMEVEIDSVESFIKSKNRRKRKIKNVDEKIEECFDPRKKKMVVVEFNDYEAASIKSIAVKKRSSIKVTTRFMSGILLMFPRLSLKSLFCDRLETFCFSDENTKEISKKYGIERVEILLVLTDTDSAALKLYLFLTQIVRYLKVN